MIDSYCNVPNSSSSRESVPLCALPKSELVVVQDALKVIAVHNARHGFGALPELTLLLTLQKKYKNNKYKLIKFKEYLFPSKYFCCPYTRCTLWNVGYLSSA